jgi:hypothetical protein
VAALFGNYFADQGKPVGIAISGGPLTTLGRWQYGKPGDST